MGLEVANPGRLFIDGGWIEPSSEAVFEVEDSTSGEVFLEVAEARETDMARAVAAARDAFDNGPWPRMSPTERAGYVRAMATGLRDRAEQLAQAQPRETGALFFIAQHTAPGVAATFDYYAGLAETFPFEQEATPEFSSFGLLVREPVGVVGAIVPWNAPLTLMSYKVAPALLAGCTVVLKPSPEAPVAALVMAEIAEAAGLPPGVLNVVTADREVSELLVRDPRVDKITFTGSTGAGRRIGAICGERIARCTLELGGKSAAVILDDYDIGVAAASLSAAGCVLSGQVCSSLTRVVVSRHRHEEMAEALGAAFSAARVGDPFDPRSQMGPLVSARQRDRVEGYIAQGQADGAALVAGGGRPAHLDRGYYIEPTVFAGVDNSSTIAREEIFGPVLCVIPAEDEQDAVRVANDSPYGLNASVFTNDIDRARAMAGQIRSGTVGHNGSRTEFSIAFGGFKQSGIGREGGVEGLLPFLETKTIVLQGRPTGTTTA